MSDSPAHVISFAAYNAAPKVTITDDPALVDKAYESKSWRCFEAPDKGAIAGIWEAEPHLERCTCDYDEMCHILEGSVRLTDADGKTQNFGAGDSFVVAAGFRGTWENLTHVRKVFFILS